MLTMILIVGLVLIAAIIALVGGCVLFFMRHEPETDISGPHLD